MTEYPEVTDQAKGEKSIQPKWKNAPTRGDFHTDYVSAENGQSAFKAKLLIWKDTRDGGPEILVTPGKSTTRPLLVRKMNEWKYPSLEDPFLSTQQLFRVSPATTADVLGAKQNGRILNYQWNTKVQKTKLVGDIVRTVVDEGTVIVKTGWITDTAFKIVDEEVPVYATAEESIIMMQQMVQAGQMSPEQAQAMLETGEPMQKGTRIEKVEKEVITKNQPTYEVCINANVTIDPTCNGVAADAQFIIHEFSTSYAELKKDEYIKDSEGNESGFYHNLNMLDENSGEIYDPHISDESNNFRFNDKARKRLKAYEYWGYWDIQGDGVLVSIVATWIGSVLIRLEENPFPHKRLPFSIATYMPVVRSVHGEPDAELLKENQEAVGRMTRAIHDITSKQAIGQEFIDENFFPSPSAKNSYEKGNTVYYRSGFDPKMAIWRKDVQQVGSAPFDVIQWQTADASELTGIKPFSGPGGAKMGGDVKDKDSMDASAKRDLSILRRLSDMLFIDMARMTIANNKEFLSEEEVVRITDSEFEVINRDDLQGDFDLRVQVSTPEKDEDQANKIMKLMQTNAANMDPEISKMHYVQMAELWKLDALASKVENYKPQPNPKQEELMSLQIEEQKLKNALAQKQLEDYDSKIYERLSRTSENERGDAALKQAKAEQALATAEKIKSETDILDSTFLEIETGVKRQKEIEDQEFKLQGELAKEEQKTSAQIGMEHIKNSLARTPGKVISEI